MEVNEAIPLFCAGFVCCVNFINGWEVVVDAKRCQVKYTLLGVVELVCTPLKNEST